MTHFSEVPKTSNLRLLTASAGWIPPLVSWVNGKAGLNQTETQLREVLLRCFWVFTHLQQVALYVCQLSVDVVVDGRPLAH